MKKIGIVFLLLFLFFVLDIFSQKLELVRCIGDDRDNYTFFNIINAAISEENEVFALDIQGYFLAKFDGDGKFVKKAGRRGQGPGDFLSGINLQLTENRLYFYDSTNARITHIGLDLKKFEYISIREKKELLFHQAHIISKDTILAKAMKVIEDKGRIRLLDSKLKTKNIFFNEVQAPHILKKRKYSTSEDLLITSLPKKKKMLVAFEYPDSKMLFGLFDYSGNLIKKFNYNWDKNFRAEWHWGDIVLDDYSKGNNLPYKSITITSILDYQNNFLVFVNQEIGRLLEEGMKKEHKEIKTFCLVFDENGTFKKKFEVPACKYFDINQKGFLVGKKIWENGEILDGDESLKLWVYKLSL